MIFDFLIPKAKIETKIEKEDIVKTKLKYKGTFDIEELYKKLHGWLKSNNWKDLQVGKDYYEKYYYEKVTREGLKFYDFMFEAKKNVNDREPKVDHFISVRVIIAPYDPNKKSGSLDIEFKGWREYEKFGGELKGILSIGKSKWEKNIYKKILKKSKKDLFNDVMSFRNEIIKFLQGYVYK